jgi:DNA (cytosine-5)-methyltransferase 1
VDSNPEREVLKHRNPTVVTPLVSCIAKTLFERTLSVAGQLERDDIEEDAAAANDVGADYTHHGDPDSIKWLEPANVDGYYQSVDMDGVVYSVSFGFFISLHGDLFFQGWRNGHGSPWPGH